MIEQYLTELELQLHNTQAYTPQYELLRHTIATLRYDMDDSYPRVYTFNPAYVTIKGYTNDYNVPLEYLKKLIKQVKRNNRIARADYGYYTYVLTRNNTLNIYSYKDELLASVNLDEYTIA